MLELFAAHRLAMYIERAFGTSLRVASLFSLKTTPRSRRPPDIMVITHTAELDQYWELYGEQGSSLLLI